MNRKYEEIINLPHPVSKKHPQMPVRDRAAQFAPFAALTGYEAAVKETARLTGKKILLDEDALAVLDRKLLWLKQNEMQMPEIRITFFVPDARKEGGSYEEAEGYLKRIDGTAGLILLTDGSRIRIPDILELSGEIFRGQQF